MQMTAQNLVAATLLAQFLFIVILVITSLISHLAARAGAFIFILTIQTLITFGILFFSDSLIELWSPVFGNAMLSGIRSEFAITLVQAANLGAAGALVKSSGGTRQSPFTGGLLLIPTLAIFLRQPTWYVLFFTIGAAVMTVAMHRRAVHKFEPLDEYVEIWDSRAALFLNIASLALATWIGLLTRPA